MAIDEKVLRSVIEEVIKEIEQEGITQEACRCIIIRKRV